MSTNYRNSLENRLRPTDNIQNVTNKQRQISPQIPSQGSYASQIRKRPEQWPALCPARYTTTAQDVRIKSHSSNSNTKFNKKNLEEKGKASNRADLLPIPLGRHNSSKERNLEHGLNSENHLNEKKYQSSANEDKHTKVSSTGDEGGWVTVTRKTNKKAPVEPELVPAKPVESLPVGLKENDDADKEEKKKLHQIRKQRIKEEKKRKREEKARELRESMRRDTKVRFISQDVINSLFKGNSVQSNRNPPQNFSRPIQHDNSSTEYPTLLGSSNYLLNRRQKTPSRDVRGNNQNLTSISTSSRSCTPDTRNEISNFESSSVHSSNVTSPGKPEVKIQGAPISRENRLGESPTKKKVKSKDLINLEIMDLIALKRKEVVTKPKGPSVTPNKIEKKGRISEVKTKKLSTLKKNMLKQKKQQTDLLLTILGDEMLNKTKKSESNQSETSNETPEQNSAASKNSKEDNSEHTEEPLSKTEKKTGKKESASASQEKEVKEKDVKGDHCNETLQVRSDSSEVPENPEVVNKEAHEDLLKEVQNLMNPVHSNKFREYCHHVITSEIDEVLKELIELLVMFQERLHHQDPIKAKVKRRYYCGLKEALKHMNRISCLIMAPNLKPSPGKGCVDELVSKVLNAASSCGVPIFFGLTLRKLGNLCHRKVSVSCVSIVNIQGAQDKFQKLVELVPKAKKQYEELIANGNVNPVAEDEPEVDSSTEEKNSNGNVTDSFLKALK